MCAYVTIYASVSYIYVSFISTVGSKGQLTVDNKGQLTCVSAILINLLAPPFSRLVCNCNLILR